jgi:hypothetical protein
MFDSTRFSLTFLLFSRRKKRFIAACYTMTHLAWEVRALALLFSSARLVDF